jgi:hypothetical protein
MLEIRNEMKRRSPKRFGPRNFLASGWFNSRMSFANILAWTGRRQAAGLMAVLCGLLWVTVPRAYAENRALPGHVPAILARLSPVGDLPATNQLHLALGLPLRDAAGLDAFLTQVYDPASPLFHKYLTPRQFTDQFGPTAADYQAVIAFARSNHLAVTATHQNRLLLDVTGAATDVQSAFHVHLRVYQHPAEARDFFSPDTEPSVDRSLPLADISGLSDYARPHPQLVRQDIASTGSATPRTGSGSGGTYGGGDFRAAYLPGVTLTGTGQSLGLLEFDGYYPSDISSYESTFGLPSVPLQTVLLDGFNGTPTTGTDSGNPEVSLDIEMAVAMAPGLSNVVVFEAGPYGQQNDVLNSMVANPQIRQFSSSWGWTGGPSTTTDNIFKEMSAQGQSCFNAVGDSDAFTTGASSVNGVDNPNQANAPSSCPYITVVGGTTLTTTGPGGAWSGETAWNWGEQKDGSYAGTSGGVSSYYAIPSWQAGVSMAANGGSSSYRNTPDVALIADNVFVVYSDGSSGTFGGTSCATPLWAGLTALMNEQAHAAGRATVGFLNPAIYAVGKSSSYAASFHDITTGSNTWSDSPDEFYAETGYDLCTGWGTPMGQNLINALAGSPDSLEILSGAGFTATGTLGGPFSNTNSTFTLTNAGPASFSWKVGSSATWLTASPASGTLGRAGTVSVTLSLAAAAGSLSVGSYPAGVTFTNVTSGFTQSFSFTLEVTEPLVILAGNGFTSIGEVGGPFNVTSATFTLTNARNSALSWSAVPAASWLSASPAGGPLAHDTTTSLTVSLNATAAALPGGLYTNSLTISDLATGGAQTFPFVLQVGQNLVQDGGFETGSFTDWTLVGDTVTRGGYIYDEVASTATYPLAVHSGNYGAFLGDDQVATLSQTLSTRPGHSYYLSLWLDNPITGSGQSFAVNWNTNTAVASTLYSLTSPPAFAWTNLTFLLRATGTNTVLQFAAENTPNYFGLDDISVTPLPVPSVETALHTKSSFSLTWYAVAGFDYEILTTTNLLNPAWTILGTNQATSSTLSYTNATATDHQRYYRILRLP